MIIDAQHTCDAIVRQLVVLVALVVGRDVRQLLDALQVVLQVRVAVQNGRMEDLVDLQCIVEQEVNVGQFVAQQELVFAYFQCRIAMRKRVGRSN